MEINLSVCRDEELNQVAEMAGRIWHQYYSAIISREQIDYMLDLFYSSDALKQQIAEGHTFYWIENKALKIGFVSCSIQNQTEVFIHKFYVENKNRGQSIGTKVMHELNQRYLKITQANSIRYRLTVNRQNFKAINFYFKNGFRIESVEDFDIGNGYFMNDFIMVKSSGIE